jgi:hypothetical protein
MNIEIGTRVEGNWGAMFPTWTGTIVRFDWLGTCEIRWDGEDDNFITKCTKGSLRLKDVDTTGSPIGIYVIPEKSS